MDVNISGVAMFWITLSAFLLGVGLLIAFMIFLVGFRKKLAATFSLGGILLILLVWVNLNQISIKTQINDYQNEITSNNQKIELAKQKMAQNTQKLKVANAQNQTKAQNHFVHLNTQLNAQINGWANQNNQANLKLSQLKGTSN